MGIKEIKRFARKKENIWNVPNALTFSRIILAFVTFYFILAGFDFRWIIASFVIGMITDFLDGQIARRFNCVTEFGRKFDMIADRFLMIGTVIALVIDFAIKGYLDKWFGFQILLLMSREIVGFPFTLIAFVGGTGIPHARFIGKLTTFMQGVTFPLIILNIFNPAYQFSIYFAIATGIIGAISGVIYANDFQRMGGMK